MAPSSVIRYVVPIKDAVFRVRTSASASGVTTVTGGQLRYEQQGEWLRVNLETLNEYEIVMVDLEGDAELSDNC